MLPVGVHDEGMREAARERRSKTVENCRALAAILRSQQHSQGRILSRHAGKFLPRPIRAAVHDDPDRVPVRARAAYGLEYLVAGVITRDENDMCRRRRAHCALLLG